VIFFKSLVFLAIVLATSLSCADCGLQTDKLFEQGKAYYKNGQYLLAANQLATFTLLTCNNAQSLEARLFWARSLYELNEAMEAERVILPMAKNQLWEGKTRIIKAWYQPELRESLTAVERDRFSEFQRQIDQLETIKKPWLAGTLSAIVPGAGQAYNGNYQSAFFSFVLNSIFLSATIELHREKMGAAALASGMLFSVVYLGNIMGSMDSSHSLNENYQRADRERIRDQVFPELRLPQ
jgi:hypothetical protein